MLRVRELDTFYGASQVLFGVGLEVGAGEVVTLMGRNGMGKTTMARSIMGLTQPRRGSALDGLVQLDFTAMSSVVRPAASLELDKEEE